MKFKELVKSLDEAKFKLPRGEKEVDSYFEKGSKGKRVPIVISKKGSKFKVYVDGNELAIYKSEKEARKNAKQLLALLGEDLDEFIEQFNIEDTLGFSTGLVGNQSYNEPEEKVHEIK